MSDVMCSATRWQYYKSVACGKRGKVERDGKWYCGIHDPVSREEREAKRSEKGRLEYDIIAAQQSVKQAGAVVVDAVLAWNPHGGAYDISVLVAPRQALLDARSREAEARQALADFFGGVR